MTLYVNILLLRRDKESGVEFAGQKKSAKAGNRDATWIYNARIHPVVPYAIRGCIWNQG